MRVETYWNLHKDIYSVRAVSGDNRGRVVDYSDFVEMQNVTFAVQPAGRAKVLVERKKNVHAFVRGDRCEWLLEDVKRNRIAGKGEWVKVGYNPYKSGSFVTQDGVEVKSAEYAMCTTYEDNGKPYILAYNVK